LDTEQNDADDQLDAVADPETGSEDQSGDQAPDPGHSGEGDGKPEYFLEVDDRTRYKTQDAARQGIQESNAKLREYRDIGSPEELKAVREENARLKRSHQELVGNEPDPDRPKRKIDSLDPKVRKEWEESRPVMEEMFDGRYMSREDFRREQDARFTAKTDRALDEILESSGRSLDQYQKNRIRASAQQAMHDPKILSESSYRKHLPPTILAISPNWWPPIWCRKESSVKKPTNLNPHSDAERTGNSVVKKISAWLPPGLRPERKRLHNSPRRHLMEGARQQLRASKHSPYSSQALVSRNFGRILRRSLVEPDSSAEGAKGL